MRASYLYLKLLDLRRPDIGFKKAIDPDLLTNRSNELGIGVTCILALATWAFPWDQLGPIKGPGRRFDYRAEGGGLRAMFEAKGSTSKGGQARQLRDGLLKKAAHHGRNDRFDIELIVATRLGKLGQGSELVLADPPFDVPPDTFGPDAEEFYRLRHWVRVAQFIGMPGLARRLLDMQVSRPSWLGDRGFSLRDIWYTPQSLDAAGKAYTGSWFQSWVPADSWRYHKRSKANEQLASYEPDIEVFQGLENSTLAALEAARSPNDLPRCSTEPPKVVQTEAGLGLSVFPDGSAFAVRARSAENQ